MRTNGFASTIVSRRWLRCHAVIPSVRCKRGRYMCGTYQFKSRYRSIVGAITWNPRLRERIIPIKTNDATFAMLPRAIPRRYWRMLLRHYLPFVDYQVTGSQPRYPSLLPRRQQSIWLTLDALWFICAPNIEWTGIGEWEIGPLTRASQLKVTNVEYEIFFILKDETNSFIVNNIIIIIIAPA